MVSTRLLAKFRHRTTRRSGGDRHQTKYIQTLKYLVDSAAAFSSGVGDAENDGRETDKRRPSIKRCRRIVTVGYRMVVLQDASECIVGLNNVSPRRLIR